MSNYDTPTDAFPVASAPKHTNHGGIAKWIRRLAIPIIIGWVAIIGVFNTIVPQLEEVMRSVSMTPDEAPSMIAMKRVGEVFQEFKSNSSVMVVLEGDQPLGEDAHKYYDEIVAKLEADKAHVEHVQDFWGDPLTASGAQSSDGKSSYVQVYTAGNQGEALANESVEAVGNIVKSVSAPDGVKAYVTGPAALSADQEIAGNRSMRMIEALTFTVIIIMLLMVYRSIITVILTLVMVVLSLTAARGVIAFLGYYNIIGLSTFATNLLVTLAIAAATDYAIFLIGRYQEARSVGSTFATNLLVTLAIAAATDYAIFLIGRYQEARSVGEDREQAYYTMFHGTAHVVLGSGLTIAGATLCLHFTRLPYFQSLGIPLAIGMVTVVGAALTIGPAIITVASRFGKVLEPKRASRTRGWRKIGAAVVRWPGPILIATIAISLVGLLTLPGYRTNYNDRDYMPADLPANSGYAAADRHFSPARMNPELLLVESDHDLRNSADFLVIERIAKRIFQVPGISRVQAITRPQGTPIEHTSIPFNISMQGTTQTMNQKYMQDRMADMLKQADEMQITIDTMDKMIALMEQMRDVMNSMVGKMHGMLDDIKELRDNISDFDDFFRPIRNYLYWEPHCYNIPMCWSIRSVFDTLDGIDTMTADFEQIVPDMDKMNALIPVMIANMQPMIATMKTMKTMMLTMQATQGGLQDQMAAMQDNSTAMGQAFDAAKNDDSFYLPPETFENEDFKRGMKMFLSPDGHAVRFIISHEGDPMSPEGIKHIDAIKLAAKEAIKGTPLEGSKIYLGGTAAPRPPSRTCRKAPTTTC
ncbi:RND family transporter [Mycolicibacterium houstonense]|uniref:MMPL/RND family transporter n=1 Tax=Mycolicibacterium houstonense TaxID=146021 RepID=UPI003F49391D